MMMLTIHGRNLAVWSLVALLGSMGWGCAHVPNQYVVDCPSLTHSLESPTSADVKARYTAAEQRHREWPGATVSPEPQVVTHWPLYFEDPFEDKGATYRHRLGWEDWVAMPYCYARFTLNWLALPVSAAVTPPWTLMESDGNLSEQCLGYDHDATRAGEEPVVAQATPAPTPDESTTAEPAAAVRQMEVMTPQ